MQKFSIFVLLAVLCLSVGWAVSCSSDDDDDSSSNQADDDAGDDDTSTTDDDTGDDDDDDAADDDDDDDTFPACEDYGSPQAIGNLRADELTEASGLAVSLKKPGVLWAHNDSGDGPFIYAMKLDGDYLGVVKLDGATAVDWEDMAAGPCGDDECLYIGDIGDNDANRTDCGVYRIVEPVIDPETPFGELTLTDWEFFPFSYPGGPRDSEALAVHPDGTVYIFTKFPLGSSEMYALPEMTPDVLVELTYLGDLDTGSVLAVPTAADIHRNGRRLLVRTAVSALEWRLVADDSFEDILTAPRLNVPCRIELRGEAIAYDPAEGGYLQVAEGQGAAIHRISCAAVQ
jgi:hypothetical protein